MGDYVWVGIKKMNEGEKQKRCHAQIKVESEPQHEIYD